MKKVSRAHLQDIAGAAFVVAVLGIGFWANQHRQSEPTADAATNVTATSGFDTFCTRAGLVAQAVRDCKEMMAKATTDEERLKVERLFAMGLVKVDRLDKP